MAERIEIILNTGASGEDYREELRMQGRINKKIKLQIKKESGQVGEHVVPDGWNDMLLGVGSARPKRNR